MALTLPRIPSTTQAVQPAEPGDGPSRRKPFRDNTRLLLVGILILLGALAGLLTLASRSRRLAPDFLTEFVLYALSATNLTMLVALGFVLARNIVKLVVERRRALPFARFRAKLVAVLLGMTIIPAVLVLLVGGEVIRNSVDMWFNAPMDEVLSSANAIAGDYYQERQRLVSGQAQRLARVLGSIDLKSADPAFVHDLVAPDVLQERISLVEVYRVETATRTDPPIVFVADAAAPSIPPGYSRTSAERLAQRTAQGGAEERVVERIAGGGELIRTAFPIRPAPGSPARGVVIASEYQTGQFAQRARRMTAAYEGYQQLRVLKQPLAGVYLSFFLMLTLMILVSATWMGLYLAKRITRPVQMLATAAREIGAGHLDHRVVPETVDEFGSLIEAFNSMAGELSASRQRLEQSSIELERKHQEVEGRRRYVETVLDRVATGVVSVDATGRIRTWNSAASRLLGVDGVPGSPASSVFGSPALKPLAEFLVEGARRRETMVPKEVSISNDGRELHLTVMTTPLRREDGTSEGVVVVFDDVTLLIHTQKVAAWREVARRLAHEIKNPLTPIQLCAERLRRHFSAAPGQTRELVDECTTTIVGEVESLKGLVNEFSEFARMAAPRAVPTDLHEVLTDALALNRGIFPDVDLQLRLADALPKVSVDPEKIRRVIINVVDNAIEAMNQRGTIEIETQHDPSNNLVRMVVADDGPGIPAAERDKIFLPYYSTKRRGSGMGLAIVRRIVVEHGGGIEVAENVPHGTRFTVELPCS